LQGLRDKGNVQKGQSVLIYGASGGVGIFAVQIAKSISARVTAVCSTSNVELLRSIGADDVIDYTREDFARSDRKFDLLFDLVGNRSLTDCLRVVQRIGTYIPCGGGTPDRSTTDWIKRLLQEAIRSRIVSQRIRGLLAKISHEDLVFLADLVQTGKVKAVVDHTYGLRDVAAAIRHVESGHARGKVVIAIS
jgi:NADPH:quinone reductase-like Zn-dependent oxidoreductase